MAVWVLGMFLRFSKLKKNRFFSFKNSHPYLPAIYLNEKKKKAKCASMAFHVHLGLREMLTHPSRPIQKTKKNYNY